MLYGVSENAENHRSFLLAVSGLVGCSFSLGRPVAGACTRQRLGLSLLLPFHVGWVGCPEAVCGGESSTDTCFCEPF